jgi:predicted SAM-dependent methyltransferase
MKKSPHLPVTHTKAEYLNVVFRWWGHKWIYDRSELRRRLQGSGFAEIADSEIGVSNHPDLCGIEQRQDSLLVCEAVKR